MFAVGTRVKIRKDSPYYKENCRTNPRDTEGVISEIWPYESFCYKVIWRYGKRDVISNSYKRNDLELINQEDCYSIY